MTRKIKLKTLVNPEFGWAISNIINAQVPAKASYWLAKIFRKTQSAEREFLAAKDKAIIKYTKHTKTAEGKIVFETTGDSKEYIWNSPTARQEFITEIDMLLEEEIEMPTIAFAMLGDDTKIETRMLLFLEEVIIQEGVQGLV